MTDVSDTAMTRRGVLSSGIAAFAATPAPARDPDAPIRERVYFRPDSGNRTLFRELVLARPEGGLWAANIAQGAPRFREDRLATQRFLPGLTRPTIRERLEDAALMGSAHLSGHRLILDVVTLAEPDQITVAHRDLSWDLLGLEFSDELSRGQSAGRRIGDVYLTPEAHLLTLLPPIW